MTIEMKNADEMRYNLNVASLYVKSEERNGRIYWYGDNSDNLVTRTRSTSRGCGRIAKTVGNPWKRISKQAAAEILAKYEITLEQFRAYENGELEIVEVATPADYAITPEAMEVAVDAEIELANATAEAAVKAEFEAIEKATELARNFSREVQELFTAKADVDTLRTAQAAYEQARAEINKEITTCHRAVDDMTKDTTDYYTEREILIGGLLEAEDKALAAKKAIYKQALLTALIERFSKNEADETKEEEPEMTVKQPTEKELIEAEMRSVAEERDKFIGELEEAEVNPEIAQSHIDYLKSEIAELGDRYQELWAQLDAINTAEVIAEDDGSNDDADETFTANVMPAEEDDNDDELVDEPNGYLYEINGHPVSNAEYVKFCESIIADYTQKRAYYWQAMQEATNDDDHDAWLHEYCDADETIQECIADIAKITGKEIVDDKSYPDDETPEPAAAEPVDEFTAELERLKAEQDAAKEKELEAKAAYDAAAEAYEERRAATQKFLDEHALKLCNEIQAVMTDKLITLVKSTGGSSCTVSDFTDVYVDAFNAFGETFIIRYWDGSRLGNYDTPAQVEQVIAMLKAAIERGDTEFTFPTIEQLNAPKIPPVKADIRDSLARAMKIALLKTQDFCREHNLKAAQDELGRYNICSAAMRELRKAVA